MLRLTLMLSKKLSLVVLFCLASSSAAQTMNSGAYAISRVLSRSHISGSLSYWSPEACEGSSYSYYPVTPVLRRSESSGPPIQILQEMFADDPKMQVSEDSRGIVRMFEKDVPKDLLDIKIHHISFDPLGVEARVLRGPNMAIRTILNTPEVEAFRKAHKIGPFSQIFRLPPDVNSDKAVSGQLEDVTVAQALDYIFQTFPGLWLYGNCPRGGKGDERNVYFWFYENEPIN
jgi:hypothetical protein